MEDYEKEAIDVLKAKYAEVFNRLTDELKEHAKTQQAKNPTEEISQNDAQKIFNNFILSKVSFIIAEQETLSDLEEKLNTRS